jgi:hypothetical protein
LGSFDCYLKLLKKVNATPFDIFDKSQRKATTVFAVLSRACFKLEQSIVAHAGAHRDNLSSIALKKKCRADWYFAWGRFE